MNGRAPVRISHTTSSFWNIYFYFILSIPYSRTTETIMASNDECSGCHNVLDNDPYLGCFRCKGKYDLVCANVASNDYELMDVNQKASWKCPECCSKEPKTGNINTPVRSAPCSDTKYQEEDAQGQSNVTVRKRPTKSPLKPSQKPLQKQLQKLPPKQSQKAATQSPLLVEPSSFVTEHKLREILQQEISTALNTTIKQIVATEFKNMLDKIDGFLLNL